jgi:putative oxidoreductase
VSTVVGSPTEETRMHPLSIPAVHRLAPAAPVVLRVVVGALMTLHGWQKLTEMGPATFGGGMLTDLGVPAGVAMGWIVTSIELVGGLLLVLGLLSRLTSIVVGLVLAGAIVLVKTDLGIIAPMGAMLPGAELDLALLAGLVGVFLLGPGRPSLDHALGIEAAVPSAEPTGPARSDAPVHA